MEVECDVFQRQIGADVRARLFKLVAQHFLRSCIIAPRQLYREQHSKRTFLIDEVDGENVAAIVVLVHAIEMSTKRRSRSKSIDT